MKTFTVWPRGARPPTLKSLFTFRSSSFAGAAVDGAELLELREALLLRAPRLGDLGLDVRRHAADDGRDGRLRAGVLLVGVGLGGRLVPSIYNHYFFLPLTSRTVFLLDIRTQLQTPAAPTYASSDGGSGASSDGGSGAMPASEVGVGV